MSLNQRSELCNLGEDQEDPRQKQDLLEEQLFKAEEAEAVAFPPSSTPSVLLSDNPEEVAAAVAPSPPRSPEGSCPSPSVMEAIPWSQSEVEGSSGQGEGGASSCEISGAQFSLQETLHLKMSDLVKFLLVKYRAKEPTTQAEMLSVITEHQDHFPEIFSRASDYLLLVFGVDVLELDPSNHTYVLLNSLGLTRDEVASDGHGMPKTGLLVIILSIIAMQGECAPEHNVWEVLTHIAVHDGVEHYIYGEPRELITKVWVEEQYLVYRQVADSDPARYEFLWGPRAHAETTRLRVLQFLLRYTVTYAGYAEYQS